MKNINFKKGTIQKMEELLKGVEKASELKRVQSVLLGAKGLQAKDITIVIGLKEQSIWRIWKRYRDEGISMIFDQRGKNRGRAYWSLQEESLFLDKFNQKAKKGEIVTVNDIIDAHKKALSIDISKGSTYYLLQKHGWRKIVPRPCHPKHNSEKTKCFREAIFPPDYNANEDKISFLQ